MENLLFLNDFIYLSFKCSASWIVHFMETYSPYISPQSTEISYSKQIAFIANIIRKEFECSDVLSVFLMNNLFLMYALCCSMFIGLYLFITCTYPYLSVSPYGLFLNHFFSPICLFFLIVIFTLFYFTILYWFCHVFF